MTPTITRYRYVEGIEHIQFIMPSTYFGTLEYMLRIKDPEALKSWLCYILGREFDLPRCNFYSIEGVSDRILITLNFSDPWFMSETSHQKYIEHGTLPNQSEREET
jgi:hypothetical protein